MAAPRWNNVPTPSNSGANALLASAGNQINQGFQGLTNAFNQYQQRGIDAAENRTNSNTDAAIANIMRAGSSNDLNGLTTGEGVLTKASLDSRYGSEYDPVQVAKAINDRSTQFRDIDSEAARISREQGQQDIENVRADTVIANTQGQRDITNQYNRDNLAESQRRNRILEGQGQQRITNKANQQVTANEQAVLDYQERLRKNLVGEGQGQQRINNTVAQNNAVNTRADTVVANNQAQRNVMNEQGQAKIDEQGRRNLVTEDQAQQRIDATAAENAASRSDSGVLSGINPATNKPFTGAQDKAMGFATRSLDATNRVNSLIADGYDAASLGNQLIPDNAAGNLVAANFSPQTQQYRQARNDWIAAVLRLESGAAIPDAEQAKYERTYFPQAGDTQATLDQKADARRSQENSLRLQSGRNDDAYGSYRPTTNAPAGAVEYLQANPDAAAAFQEKYGYLPN